MATINHKTYNEGTETFKDFSVYDGKDTLIFKVDGSSGGVGIGTSAPAQKLDVAGTLRVSSATPTEEFFNTTNGDVWASIFSQASGTGSGASLVFSTKRDGDSATDKMIITQAGNVGIGNSAPASKFHVAGADAWMTLQRTSGTTNIIDFTDSAAARIGYIGAIASNISVFSTGSVLFAANSVEVGRFTPNGLTFNGDTLAANALDDYEEGTFVPSVAFGGASVGITYFDRIGNYTKIGRQIFVTLYVALTNSGSSTGSATIEGLPFTNGNVNRGNQAVGSIRFDNITYTGTLQVFVPNSTTQISFQQVTEAGTDALLTHANFNGASEMSISLSYFV